MSSIECYGNSSLGVTSDLAASTNCSQVVLNYDCSGITEEESSAGSVGDTYYLITSELGISSMDTNNKSKIIIAVVVSIVVIVLVAIVIIVAFFLYRRRKSNLQNKRERVQSEELELAAEKRIK